MTAQVLDMIALGGETWLLAPARIPRPVTLDTVSPGTHNARGRTDYYEVVDRTLYLRSTDAFVARLPPAREGVEITDRGSIARGVRRVVLTYRDHRVDFSGELELVDGSRNGFRFDARVILRLARGEVTSVRVVDPAVDLVRLRRSLPGVVIETDAGTLDAALVSHDALSTDARDRAMLAALREHPGDVAARAVYADWLEQEGAPHLAAFVRGRPGEWSAQVVAVTSDLDWRAIVSCAELSPADACVRAGCPRTWHAYAPTDGVRRRPCGLCSQSVRYSLQDLVSIALGPSLVVLRGDDREVFALATVNTIGRHPDNTIQILDRSLAREHARIERAADGRYVLRDLQTPSGTFLRGERIVEHYLRDGDELAMGSTRIIFVENE